jgi:hypothetical protein
MGLFALQSKASCFGHHTLGYLLLSMTLLLDLYRAGIGLLSAFRKRIHNLFRALWFLTHPEVAR